MTEPVWPEQVWPEKEWLETNGIGGYASSTVSGMNTRRYHGLLVAATRPPLGRMVLLSKLEETLVVREQRFELSANRWASGVVQTAQYLEDFRLDPFPVWTYSAGGVRLVRRLFMVQGENTVVVEYEIDGGVLEVRPLVACRDFHALTHANTAFDAELLHFAHNASALEPTGVWYYGFDYERERERGLEAQEDLYQPFLLRFTEKRGVIVASTERRGIDVKPRAAQHRADQFIVKRGEFHSIIAGYHWFGDWGRDTMISLTGLTLVTGRADVAKSILLAYAGSVSEGMLPNRFPDYGETPEYNTVDATLWFFEAVRSYLEYTNDVDFVRERLFPVLRGIVDWHIRGTRYGIRMDDDGLLKTDGAQLTWMDTAATPRRGKAVEIQALWHNALRILEMDELAARVSESFNAQFWNEAEGCLLDMTDDASIRPNQVLAVSLPHSMLSKERAARVLDVVERDLLTPVGLRSLSPRDSRYRGRYEGDPTYHQGTVWPWLIGPWVTACMKIRGRVDLKFDDTGLIPEIYDGDAPHTPRGCIAQAWSLAELLRVSHECKNSEVSGFSFRPQSPTT